jgi:two-component system NtrC family sensor kinase
MSTGTPKHNTGKAGDNLPGAPAYLQQNLQRLDRLANLGLFSASIAHEIKNGLVAVNTFCEVLLEKNENPEMAGMVRRELKRIDGLVTQMLRLAAAKPTPVAAVNIHTLLDLTLRLLEHQMNGRLINLRREYHAQSEMIQGDESRLQQAFMNLLLNAVEAMGEGGELTVATESQGGRLTVVIRDTGAGIAPENLEHIFETFFTTKKYGTGLGLAITQRVLDEHQGAIEVESEVGRGSTFTIRLPHI